jgi:hypothetical protein
MKRIIYQNSEGGVSVIIPTESVELALKDVPEGVAYEIVEDDAIPVIGSSATPGSPTVLLLTWT